MIKPIYFGIIIVIIGTIINSIGAFFFKIASKRLTKGYLYFFKNVNIYAGVSLYLFSVLIFVYALRFGELSTLYSIGALTYIWVYLLSIKFLKEKMNRYRWLGISLIILGVVFIGLGA